MWRWGRSVSRVSPTRIRGPRGVAPRRRDVVTGRHWVVLGASAAAAAASSTIVMGAAYLLPALHTGRGLSLAQAGLVVAMPQVGILTALLAWGWLVDRVGERLVLLLGLALTALATGAAALSGGLGALSAWLFLAGAAAASTNSASGRVVIGWFPPRGRGLAMGVRQMSTPLGAALGALTMPVLARDHGLGAALAVPAAACAGAALLVAFVVADPPRPQRGGAGDVLVANPYRASGYLARIHGVSVLLVVPQALMSAYLLVWLMTAQGWGAVAAGLVVTAGQVLGAVGRIVVGAWSDRAGSRMGPLRLVALAAAGCAILLALAEATPALPRAIAIVLAVALTVVSVADNGLAFTAVAEYAGPFWSGRALGAQNTSQFLAMAAATPAFGWLVERHGYVGAFVVAAVVAGLAVPLVPRADRHAERA